jgi:hypothetical protein
VRVVTPGCDHRHRGAVAQESARVLRLVGDSFPEALPKSHYEGYFRPVLVSLDNRVRCGVGVALNALMARVLHAAWRHRDGFRQPYKAKVD